MKKLVLAMACVLSLGLLASCKQGVQDVNLQNQEKTTEFKNVGKVTFTSIAQKEITGAGTTASPYAISDVTGQSFTASDYKFASEISATKDKDALTSNVEGSWTFNIAFKQSWTNGSAEVVVPVTIYKVAGKYYTDKANMTLTTSGTFKATREAVVTFSEGDPESDTFTIDSLGIAPTSGDRPNYYELKGIKFTKATE